MSADSESINGELDVFSYLQQFCLLKQTHNKIQSWICLKKNYRRTKPQRLASFTITKPDPHISPNRHVRNTTRSPVRKSSSSLPRNYHVSTLSQRLVSPYQRMKTVEDYTERHNQLSIYRKHKQMNRNQEEECKGKKNVPQSEEEEDGEFQDIVLDRLSKIEIDVNRIMQQRQKKEQERGIVGKPLSTTDKSRRKSYINIEQNENGHHSEIDFYSKSKRLGHLNEDQEKKCEESVKPIFKNNPSKRASQGHSGAPDSIYNNMTYIRSSKTGKLANNKQSSRNNAVVSNSGISIIRQHQSSPFDKKTTPAKKPQSSSIYSKGQTPNNKYKQIIINLSSRSKSRSRSKQYSNVERKKNSKMVELPRYQPQKLKLKVKPTDKETLGNSTVGDTIKHIRTVLQKDRSTAMTATYRSKN